MENRLKNIAAILLLFFVVVISSQEPFFKSFGGNGNDYGESIKYCSDSGFIITGGTESFGNGLMDLYFIKLSKDGSFEWHKTFGGSGIDYGNDIIQTYDSNYIACGYSNSLNMDYQILLIKIDSSGNEIWSKDYGGNDWDFGHKIIKSKTDSSQYFIIGKTYSYGSGNADAFLMKIDTHGDSLWMKTYGGLDNDEFNDLMEDDSGYLYATGSYSSSINLSSLWISKMNQNGDTIWNFKSELSNTYGKSITKIGNQIVYCGKYDSINNSSTTINFFNGIVDSIGQVFSNNSLNFNSNYDESCVKVIPNPISNNYILIGNQNDNGLNKIFYSEMNSQNVLIGDVNSHGNGNDFVHNADTIGNKNSFIVIGTTQETSNGYTDIFVSKIVDGVWSDSYNNNLLLKTPEIKSSCLMLYPNPSKDYIYLSNLNKAEKLIISDLKGAIIKQFDCKRGSYNISDILPGLYLITIEKTNGTINNLKFRKL
jgi:hypothetical protein